MIYYRKYKILIIMDYKRSVMIVEILDKTEGKDNKNCYLCKASLFDYLEGLADDFDKFDIQRKIVSNR